MVESEWHPTVILGFGVGACTPPSPSPPHTPPTLPLAYPVPSLPSPGHITGLLLRCVCPAVCLANLHALCVVPATMDTHIQWQQQPFRISLIFPPLFLNLSVLSHFLFLLFQVFVIFSLSFSPVSLLLSSTLSPSIVSLSLSSFKSSFSLLKASLTCNTCWPYKTDVGISYI